jgi:hypothetical protein
MLLNTCSLLLFVFSMSDVRPIRWLRYAQPKGPHKRDKLRTGI